MVSGVATRSFRYFFNRMSIFFLTISFMVCLLAAVLFLFNPSQSLALPSVSLSNLQQVLPSYLQSHHHGWWDQGSNIPDYCSKDRWNILYHLGGNGPWIEKVDGVTEGGINVPEGCEVDMVHMVHPISQCTQSQELELSFRPLDVPSCRTISHHECRCPYVSNHSNF